MIIQSVSYSTLPRYLSLPLPPGLARNMVASWLGEGWERFCPVLGLIRWSLGIPLLDYLSWFISWSRVVVFRTGDGFVLWIPHDIQMISPWHLNACCLFQLICGHRTARWLTPHLCWSNAKFFAGKTTCRRFCWRTLCLCSDYIYLMC